jgi:protein-S-isoprenylcysteine O-methyltransferase Ste14
VTRVAKDAPKYAIIPPLALGAPLFLGLVLSRFWPVSTGIPRTPRLVLAVALGLAFVVVNGAAYSMMLRARTGILPDQPVRRILTHGPFAYSRNPLYVGLLAAYAGVALAMDSAWALALFPIAALALHGAVLREERFLEDKFGQEYLEYKRRVRRWL